MGEDEAVDVQQFPPGLESGRGHYCRSLFVVPGVPESLPPGTSWTMLGKSFEA